MWATLRSFFAGGWDGAHKVIAGATVAAVVTGAVAGGLAIHFADTNAKAALAEAARTTAALEAANTNSATTLKALERQGETLAAVAVALERQGRALEELLRRTSPPPAGPSE